MNDEFESFFKMMLGMGLLYGLAISFLGILLGSVWVVLSGPLFGIGFFLLFILATGSAIFLRSLVVRFHQLISGLESKLDASFAESKFYSESAGTKIENVPLSGISKVLRFVFTKKTYDRVFETTISDTQVEYIEALAGNEEKHACWIVWRGHLILFKVVIEYCATAAVIGIVRDVINAAKTTDS